MEPSSGRVDALYSDTTARVYPAISADEGDSVFKYIDTATRAGIGAVNAKLAGKRIGIAGLGGTGVYVLDFVAKTHVVEIRVIDGDVFSQHNAFRAPGAPTLEQLRAKPHRSFISTGCIRICATASSFTMFFLMRPTCTCLTD